MGEQSSPRSRVAKSTVPMQPRDERVLLPSSQRRQKSTPLRVLRQAPNGTPTAAPPAWKIPQEKSPSSPEIVEYSSERTSDILQYYCHTPSPYLSSLTSKSTDANRSNVTGFDFGLSEPLPLPKSTPYGHRSARSTKLPWSEKKLPTIPSHGDLELATLETVPIEVEVEMETPKSRHQKTYSLFPQISPTSSFSSSAEPRPSNDSTLIASPLSESSSGSSRARKFSFPFSSRARADSASSVRVTPTVSILSIPLSEQIGPGASITDSSPTFLPRRPVTVRTRHSDSTSSSPPTSLRYPSGASRWSGDTITIVTSEDGTETPRQGHSHVSPSINLPKTRPNKDSQRLISFSDPSTTTTTQDFPEPPTPTAVTSSNNTQLTRPSLGDGRMGSFFDFDDSDDDDADNDGDRVPFLKRFKRSRRSSSVTQTHPLVEHKAIKSRSSQQAPGERGASVGLPAGGSGGRGGSGRNKLAKRTQDGRYDCTRRTLLQQPGRRRSFWLLSGSSNGSLKSLRETETARQNELERRTSRRSKGWRMICCGCLG